LDTNPAQPSTTVIRPAQHFNHCTNPAKPPTFPHSPFRPSLRPSPPSFRSASLQIHKSLQIDRFTRPPRRAPAIADNQTAATPILAFLITLDCLTFIEIAAGMLERWVLIEMHLFVWLSTYQLTIPLPAAAPHTRTFLIHFGALTIGEFANQ
jgi:hypothetical protein